MISLFDKTIRIDSIASDKELCKVILIHNIHYLTLNAHKLLSRFMKQNNNGSIILICTTLSYNYNLNAFLSYGKYHKCEQKSELISRFEKLSLKHTKPYWQETIDNWLAQVFKIKKLIDIKKITDDYVTNCYNLWISNISFNDISKYMLKVLTHRYLISDTIMFKLLDKSCEIDNMLRQKCYHSIIYYQYYFNFVVSCIVI